MSEVRPNKAGRFPCVIENAMEGECTITNVALGNMTQYRFIVAPTRRGVMIGIENKGCYEFGGFVHKGYVQEKLGLKFEGDCAAVADFINDQLKNNSDRQATYMEHLCRGDQ